MLNFPKLKEQYINEEYARIVTAYDQNLINTKSPNSMMIVAMALRNENRIDESIQIFQQLTQSKNTTIKERALIEMASSYYLNGNNTKTLELCNLLIKSSNNKQIVQNAQNLQSIINKDEKETKNTSIKRVRKLTRDTSKKQQKGRTFYGSFGVNYVFDSNPNMSTAANQIYLYGVAVENQKANEDHGVNVNGALGYNHNLTENVKIYGNLSTDFTAYGQYKNRDLLYISAFQGISYTHEKSTFALMGTYNNMYIGIDTMSKPDNYYMMMYGATPSFTYDFGFLKAQTSYRYIKKDTKGFSDRTGNMHLFSQNLYSFITKTTMVNAGMSGGFEETVNTLYNNNIYILNTSIRQFAPYNIPAYLDVGYSLNLAMYQNYDPAFRKTRQDIYNTIRTAIHYIHESHLDFSISYSYSDNNSNIDLYNFNRHQIMTGVSFVF
ncbi:MAG: Surface lipoprotein assembly modifier, partial [Pseudomonadota bacterium]